MRRRRSRIADTAAGILEVYAAAVAECRSLPEDARRAHVDAALAAAGVDLIDVIRARRDLRRSA